MLNAEKFKDGITAIMNKSDYFAIDIDNPNAVRHCGGFECKNCVLHNNDYNDCNFVRIKWLLSEYKEPPVKVSKLEYDILKWIKENTQFEYIVRNEIGHLFASSGKPAKQQYVWTYRERTHELSIFDKLFKFVKCEDEKPTLIQSILENCEVVDDD